MASRVYFSAADATERTNTDSSTYTDGVTLTFTATNAKDYVVFWSCSASLDTLATDSVQVRLYEDSAATERVFQTWEPKEITAPVDYRAYGGMYKFTGAGASITFKIQLKREGASGNAKGKQFSIVALELAAGDVYAESLGRSTTTSSTPQTKLTLNITPGSQGDYLLIYSGNVDTVAALGMDVTALVDGSSIQVTNDQKVAKDTTDRMAWCRVYKKTAWTAAAHTAAITYFESDTGSSTVGITDARILALRLDGFDANYYAEDFTGGASTSATYQDRVTLTQNPTAAGDHLIIGSGESCATNSATVSSYGDFTEDGTTLQESVEEVPSSTFSDEMLMPVFRISDLTAASHTWKFRTRSETTSVSTFGNGSIAVLQVEATAGAVSVTVVPGAAEIAGATLTVTASNHQSVTVVPGAAEIVGSTLNVVVNNIVTVVPGALEIAGSTLSVAVSDNQSVTVVPGAAEVVGSTLNVATTDHQTVTVVPGAVEIAGQTLNVTASDHQTVTVVPGAAEIVGETLTVTVDAGGAVSVEVVPGALHLVGSVLEVTATSTATPELEEQPFPYLTQYVGGGPSRRRKKKIEPLPDPYYIDPEALRNDNAARILLLLAA